MAHPKRQRGYHRPRPRRAKDLQRVLPGAVGVMLRSKQWRHRKRGYVKPNTVGATDDVVGMAAVHARCTARLAARREAAA